MQIRSPVFKQSQRIPSKYSCDGKDINPPLEFSGVPPNAKSLCLIMDDPDVPISIRRDGLYVHWIYFNIPPTLRGIEENSRPPGIAGKNTGGRNGYTGPCPPDREHRYFFKLYALDTLLPLEQGATKPEVEKAMEGHILAQTELMGVYERNVK